MLVGECYHKIQSSVYKTEPVLAFAGRAVVNKHDEGILVPWRVVDGLVLALLLPQRSSLRAFFCFQQPFLRAFVLLIFFLAATSGLM